MRELVIGKGFIGRAYENFTSNQGNDVHQASRRPGDGSNEHYIDMNDPEAIDHVLDTIRPDIIVNCAAILGRNPGENLENNAIYTRNLLESVGRSGLDLSRVVILGSAAEYGSVTEEELPISETAPLNPDSAYGQSKRREVEAALELADKNDLSVVVGRVFNPLGLGLPPSNLTSRVLGQVKAIRDGERPPVVEVRSLDAARDYLHVDDCVRAMGMLAYTGDLPYRVYNIASGERVSNGQVIDSILRQSDMSDVEVKATDTTPEQLVGAVQADISRLRELGYTPKYSIEQTLGDMVEEAGLAA